MFNKELYVINSFLQAQHLTQYDQTINIYLFKYFLQELYINNHFIFYNYLTTQPFQVVPIRRKLAISHSESQFIFYTFVSESFMFYFLKGCCGAHIPATLVMYIKHTFSEVILDSIFGQITHLLLILYKQDINLFKQSTPLTVQYYDYVYLFFKLFKHQEVCLDKQCLPMGRTLYYLPINDLKNEHLSYNLLICAYYQIYHPYSPCNLLGEDWYVLCYSNFFSFYYYNTYLNSSEPLKTKYLYFNGHTV